MEFSIFGSQGRTESVISSLRPQVNFLSELVIMICTLYFLTFHLYPVSRRRGGETGVYKDTCIEFQVRLYFRNFLTQGIYLECLHLFLACFLILGH